MLNVSPAGEHPFQGRPFSPRSSQRLQEAAFSNALIRPRLVLVYSSHPAEVVVQETGAD